MQSALFAPSYLCPVWMGSAGWSMSQVRPVSGAARLHNGEIQVRPSPDFRSSRPTRTGRYRALRFLEGDHQLQRNRRRAMKSESLIESACRVVDCVDQDTADADD